ncbi:hypothetical protein MLD38_014588 [Melastoma candidum]|uniref:Uncharacterized protein n=1 Tax=Melastoma candidum TaxID=119954 RepID=A0ACB9RDU8_9MYRT|nr:hypothetical protein MLD38_014588 [Melastoma candidum]
MQQMGSEYSDFYATILGGFFGSVVVEASVLAVKSLACSLLMVTYSACAVNALALDKEVSQMFPFDELYAVKKPGPENVDGSETEDDDDEDEAEDPEDDDEDEEEEGGEANGDEEGDPEDEPDANDGGNEDEDEDDDDEDDDEDGEDEDEEDEEEEEDEDELPQPPSKKRK